MKTLPLLFLVAALTGCSTLTDRAQNNASQTDKQSRQNFVPTDREQAVLLAAIQAMQQIIPSKVEDIPEDGVAQTLDRDTVLIIDGVVQYDKAGDPIRVHDRGTFKWSFNADITQIEDGEIRWLYSSPLADGDHKYSTQPFNGFYAKFGGVGETKTNADALKAIADGREKEKRATGDATAQILAADWEGRRKALEGAAVLVTASGQQISGILQNLSPVISSTAALAKILMKDGSSVKATVAKPSDIIAAPIE